MDLSRTIQPRSDQLNADDMVAGPVTVTIAEVKPGTDEQPVNVHLAEFPGRPYKPSLSMRRVLVAAWGPDSTVYIGRKLTLFRNPTIRFGREEVGGIQIEAMSDLDKPLRIPLTVTRGKRANFTVQPLKVEPPIFDVPTLATADEYRDHWARRKAEGATPTELTAIQHAAQTLTDNTEETA